MTECFICGSEKNLTTLKGHFKTICKVCNENTPQKVFRSQFDKAYWVFPEEVPEGTKREFYNDYLSSVLTLDDYIETTVEKQL